MVKMFFGMLVGWLVVIGCYPDEEKSDTEFIAMTQVYESMEGDFLIKKSHQSKLIIDVGFMGNKNCGLDNNYLEGLNRAIEQSLQVWFSPLKTRKDIDRAIVDNFVFRQKNVKTEDKIWEDTEWKGYDYWSYREVFDGIDENDLADLAVVFHCETGTPSFAAFYEIPTVHLFQPSGDQWVLATDQRGWVNGVSRINGKQGYRKEIIHHEIGHAFGLGDTYARMGFNSTTTRISTDGDKETGGSQPLSVMGGSRWVKIDSSGKLQLFDDDVAGINWLYDFYLKKNIKPTDCPDDYTYEETTKGCRPSYPLIFVVKQNNSFAIRRLLDFNDTIDIDEQDTLGNTALHYAAYSKTLHGDNLYKFLVSRGANGQIKNNSGRTAFAIANEQQNPILSQVISEDMQGLLGTISKATKSCKLDETAMIMVGCEDQEALRSILNKIDINAKSKNGQTLLHQAVADGNFEVVNFLLTLDYLNLNVKNKNGKIALHDACRLTVESSSELLDSRFILEKKYCNHIHDDIDSGALKFIRFSLTSYLLMEKQTKLWKTDANCRKAKELQERCNE